MESTTPPVGATSMSLSPNQAWGDSRVGNHFVTFTLKIPCDACENTTCNDFSVSIANFGDGQTGGYSSNKCNGSVMASKKMSLEAKKNQFNKVLQNKTFSNFLFLSRSHYCVNQVKLVNN